MHPRLGAERRDIAMKRFAIADARDGTIENPNSRSSENQGCLHGVGRVNGWPSIFSLDHVGSHVFKAGQRHLSGDLMLREDGRSYRWIFCSGSCPASRCPDVYSVVSAGIADWTIDAKI
jgi:hypothetical protein